MTDELTSLIAGLRQPQKMISPKYFYDETGSKLFDDITQQPEYYLTDTVAGLVDRGREVRTVTTDDPQEAIGINTVDELQAAEALGRIGAPEEI